MDLKKRSKNEYERKQVNVLGIGLGAWVSLNMSFKATTLFSLYSESSVLSEILYMLIVYMAKIFFCVFK